MNFESAVENSLIFLGRAYGHFVKIKKLIELVEESGITELEVQEEEGTVRISRAAPAVAPAAINMLRRLSHQLRLLQWLQRQQRLRSASG